MSFWSLQQGVDIQLALGGLPSSLIPRVPRPGLVEIVKQPAYWHHRPSAWWIILDINRKRTSVLIQWALSDGVTATGITVVGVACFRVNFSIGCQWAQKVFCTNMFFLWTCLCPIINEEVRQAVVCLGMVQLRASLHLCHHPRSLKIVLCQDQSPGSYLTATSSYFQICWTQSHYAVPQGSSYSPC